MAGDDVTLGELSRSVNRIEAAVNALRGEVLTSRQWQAEREHIEHRLNEAQQAASEAKAAAVAEGAKGVAAAQAVETKVENDRESSRSFKRGLIIAIASVIVLWAGQAVVLLINVSRGAGTP
jgi:hypothetical protein